MTDFYWSLRDLNDMVSQPVISYRCMAAALNQPSEVCCGITVQQWVAATLHLGTHVCADYVVRQPFPR